MKAFRHSYTVKNNELVIKLPTNFKATLVDVIVLPTEEKDWYNDLTFEQKKSIENARADLKAGRVTPHEDVKKQIRRLIENKKSA